MNHCTWLKSYDGTVSLHKMSPTGGQLGGRLVERCFVAPFSSRWVQFAPFLNIRRESWVLSWGKGPKQRYELPVPRLGEPAVVLLDSDDVIASHSRDIRSFPASLFPTSALATRGLRAVILDHEPQWESARQKAFLDWVRRGGDLHLLKLPSGRYPHFEGELSRLNSTQEKNRFGAGTVQRHAIVRAELDATWLSNQAMTLSHSANQQAPTWTIETLLFQRMGQFVRPNHNWLVIYLAGVFLLVLVDPVHWYLSRTWFDYRVSILFLCGLVVLFAFLFFYVGRCGHGERSYVHTLAHARPLSAGQFDVTQYSNVFVTRGDNYRMTHNGTHNLYSTAQQYEAVNALIDNGQDGHLLVDMPLFSSRQFIHRGIMSAGEVSLRVVQWPEQNGLLDLVLATDDGLLDQVLEIWAVRRAQLCQMQVAGDRIVPLSPAPNHYQDELDLNNLRNQSI